VSDTPVQPDDDQPEDHKGGAGFAGEHPDEPDVAEQEHPNQ
jgi:hypothetical protein